MSDFKNQDPGVAPGNNKLTMPTMELANCELKWTKDPAGGEQGLNVVAEKKVKHAVRFHTFQESIWIKRTKETNKNVILEFSWGKNKKDKIAAGEKWARVDLGKPPGDSHWIVEIEIKSGEAFYLWPFAIENIQE